MRDRDCPRFLGVIDEVALGVEIGLFTDNLDAVLVGTDSTVTT